MFDTGLPGPEDLAVADEGMVIAAVTGWACVEAAASARRLAAIAELVRRRADGPTDCAQWSCDNWDSMAAEVAAALHVSHGMASAQMYLGVALRDRLPKVAALFVEGAISARLVAAIVWRTDLIKDAAALALADTTLAEEAIRFGPLSVAKTEQAIDAIVDRYDPAALRRTRAAARGRDVVIDSPHGQDGTTNVWGTLYSTDAAVLNRRLGQMADGVCDEDPRTIAQRRADALGALAAGADRLVCGCGDVACPAGVDVDQRARSVVIHVVAEESALTAAPDPHMSGERRASEALAVDPEPDPPGDGIKRPAGRMVSGGAVPAPLLAELIRGGAKVTPVGLPVNAAAEPCYRPSAALERFIRCRDLTCRFPGCDRAAEFCDIDHTVAYPLGPTHPSNLKCVCRKHHLLKTFWTGWSDEQWPDGTIVWTAPSGQTYTTRPGSRLLFPRMCLPTGELPTAPTDDRPLGDRGIMMPRRRRTRQQDRAYRIDAERALNAAHVAERNKPPPF
ncbi:HNH endonuclease signature motif containing protein [Mycobacterium sp.]|jgi:hypothetical protein|uniref:HNH endonuclease signature motif containing protein n=1 Tax=Mycobacterium sp. TaxID=1785 RepID=UPI002BE2AC65|nr:DUF222 domain-containing protein [Mycobacterium sp.]HXB86463.1 DUF222 domain-containing protein [Mycobacterium sp.]